MLTIDVYINLVVWTEYCNFTWTTCNGILWRKCNTFMNV